MKTPSLLNPTRRLILALLTLATLLSLVPPSLAGNSSNEIRLAVGPFFAPAANDSLRSISVALPDLLTAELSHEGRFQMVEREKVEAVCRELNLSASGLVAQSSVAKLGQMLACDWFVSGTLVPCGSRTLVWTKVIDVRKGVILDIAAQELQSSDLSATATSISSFVRAAKPGATGRQFIALDPITDMSPSLSFKRDDWPRKISALIEKHYHEAGFGVVELAAVMPILEERRLEAAGLTGSSEQRVKLQAAFWVVDGGCEWVDNSMTKLNIGLRVQKVGGSEQMFRLTAIAGEDVEKAVLRTLENALTKTDQMSPEDAAKAEVDFLTKRGMERARRDQPFRPKTFAAGDQKRLDRFIHYVEQMKRKMEDRHATLANYERLLLRDPKNLQAKHMLGYGLVGDPDPAARERGKQLLQEVIDSKNPQYVERTQQALKNTAIPAEPDDEFFNGNLSTDLEGLEKTVAEQPSDLHAKYNLGALLLHSDAGGDRGRGADLLLEVIEGDTRELADKARTILPGWEKAQKIKRVNLAAAQKLKAARDQAATNEEEETEKRTKFLQQNFAAFVPFQFQKSTNSEAVIQYLRVSESRLEFDGKYYCGFKFTVPQWLDGDFQWMHVLAKTEGQKDFFTSTMTWFIIPESGRSKGFQYFSRESLAGYPYLQQRFPHTHGFYRQDLDLERLEPGRTYGIWFGFLEEEMPDIAIAMTIGSERGAKEFGVLPLR